MINLPLLLIPGTFANMEQQNHDDGIYNYPRQFWIYFIVMTLLFSIPMCLLYGQSLLSVLLIIVSYAIVNLISCILSPSNIKRLGFLTWLLGGIAYILDLWLIDLFASTNSEPYSFVVSQIYLIPVGALAGAVMCLAGGALLKHSIRNDSKEIL